MLNIFAIWQIAEEPNVEPVLRNALAFLDIALSLYLAMKVFFALGTTSRKPNGILTGVRGAIHKSDHATISMLAKNVPVSWPEVGLTKLASLTDVRESKALTSALAEADLRFQAVTRKLTAYVEALHTLVWLTLIASALWFARQLEEIFVGISSETHISTPIAAAIFGQLATGLTELLALALAIYVFERLCAFQISRREVQWKLFLASLTD